MTEAQSINVNLDSKSIDILRDVDSTFRDTLVNIGLRMVANTNLYNTLLGKTLELDAVDMVNLSEDSKELSTSKNKETDNKPKKQTQTWDF